MVSSNVSPLYLWSKLCKKIRGSAVINSRIHRTSKIEAGSHIVNTSFDRHSFCGYDCEIINCEVGSFCSIANNVTIGGSQHPIEWVSTSPVFREGRDSVRKKYSEHQFEGSKKTIIGHDVWIGDKALIKQGITVGTGAVIGMGTVVTKNVEPYQVVAGCPARVIRKRFDDLTIEKLLNTEWWNFTDEELYKYAPYFTNPNIFLAEKESELG